MMMKKYVLVLIVSLIGGPFNPTQAQVEPIKQDTTAAAPRGVVLYADSRLTVVEKKNTEVKKGGVIRSGRGYRVQIYSGTDRAKASQIRMDFMRHYPSMRSYLTYISPQYRVKVGDFQDRADAQRWFNTLRHTYNPSMVVPDIIEINTLKDD